MQTSTRTLLLRVVFALAATVGFISPSQAVIYKGSWDPDFGGIFPNLGWRGYGTFILPQRCIDVGSPCLDPTKLLDMRVEDAHVQFYDNTDGSKTTLQDLNFGSNVLVNRMDFTKVGDVATLTSVGTGFFVPSVQGSISVAQSGGNNYYFHLFFTDGFAKLVYTKENKDPGCSIGLTTNTADCGVAATGAAVRFEAIPEPGTSALALIALTGLFGLRRIRKTR